MKEKRLVFLKPFRIQRPTQEQKERFNGSELAKLMSCGHLGKIYSSDMIPDDHLEEFILTEARKHGAECLICEDECATAALALHGYQRFLVNPRVKGRVLETPTEYERRNVYAFFKDAYEQDYAEFQKLFPQAAWFEHNNGIDLFSIHDWIQSLIDGEEW